MAKHIENGLNIGKKVVVEAGTGTGKTLAYLIPSIEWAIKNKKKYLRMVYGFRENGPKGS